MTIQPIRTQTDLEQAKARLYELMSRIIEDQATAQEKDEREVLAILVDVYVKQQNHPRHGAQNPMQLIEQEMERLSYNQGEFAHHLGIHQSHLSDVVRGKRGVSKATARALLRCGAPSDDVLRALLYQPE